MESTAAEEDWVAQVKENLLELAALDRDAFESLTAELHAKLEAARRVKRNHDNA